MATAAAIEAKIAEAQQLLEQRREENRLAQEETVAADERQRLRRELDRINALVDNEVEDIGYEECYRQDIDNDVDGSYLPDEPPHSLFATTLATTALESTTHASNHQTVNCSDAVCSGEMEWKIVGMSWLSSTLKQREDPMAECDLFKVGEEKFDLLFDPDRLLVHKRNGKAWKSSLSVRHFSQAPITFRHAFFIKRADGEFVQWGESREESQTKKTNNWCYGPDCVRHREPGTLAAGIFGLDHEALLRSEWVVGDALTVKVRCVACPSSIHRALRHTQPPSLRRASSVDAS